MEHLFTRNGPVGVVDHDEEALKLNPARSGVSFFSTLSLALIVMVRRSSMSDILSGKGATFINFLVLIPWAPIPSEADSIQIGYE